MSNTIEHVETLVIGGGQAGLSVGYHLARLGLPFLIVDANHRVGDSWRNRWDSLRLFTPNRFNSLDGMPFPGDKWGFPTKDEVADYLETYALRFELPVRNGVKVERLSREGDRFRADAGEVRFEADNVVVAMASWQKPRVPSLADELGPSITQLHVAEYKNPGQLQDGDVLVVGAGNSGAEIAFELVGKRHVWLSGPDTGHIPVRPGTIPFKILMPFIGKVILHRVLATSTPIGRRARPKMINKGEPLLRVKPKDLEAAGVERVARTVGVEAGRPRLEDGRVLDAANVVWCTGFEPGFSWIDLAVFEDGQVKQDRGVVETMPGLYFIGLKFLYAPSSSNLPGVPRDARYVVGHIASDRSHRGSGARTG